MSSNFDIIVKTLTGQEFPVKSINGSTSVKQIKQQVYEQTNVPIAQQKLIFDGVGMDDSRTAASYGLSSSSQVYIVIHK